MAARIKFRVRDGLALAASLGSVLLGYLLIGHFVMATLTWTGMLGPPDGGAWYPAVYYLTHSWVTLLLVGWSALALALGAAGFALAGRDSTRRRPAALSSIAARFAIGGLVAGGVDVVFVAILLFIGRFWLWSI